jgi:hypothetical protein
VTEFTIASDVVLDLVVELLPVCLFGQFNPVGLFNLETKLLRRLAQVVVDVISNSEHAIVVLVDHNPLVLQQVSWLMDGSLAQSIVITLHDLLVRDHLRCCKNLCLHSNRVSFHLDRPVFDSFLVEQSGDHLGDPFQFFSWVDPCMSQGISHTSTFSD